MGIFMQISYFILYALVAVGELWILSSYGNFIVTQEGGFQVLHIVLLCLVLATIWVLALLGSRQYIRFASKNHKMFRHVDKYGLESVSSFGVVPFTVLNFCCIGLFLWKGVHWELFPLRIVGIVFTIAYFVFFMLWYITVWSRCQTYRWCPKCGRYWGKTYEVADEISRETHEYKYKERERHSTVENANGQVVASVYNDVEKTGYTVTYFYRLRHHCRHCGDWEEKIHVDRPKGFDGSWMEPLQGETPIEHINVNLTPPAVGAQPSAPKMPAAPVQQPLSPSDRQTQVGYDYIAPKGLEDAVVKQITEDEIKRLSDSDSPEQK